jgi:hypothetical protein
LAIGSMLGCTVCTVALGAYGVYQAYKAYSRGDYGGAAVAAEGAVGPLRYLRGAVNPQLVKKTIAYTGQRAASKRAAVRQAKKLAKDYNSSSRSGCAKYRNACAAQNHVHVDYYSGSGKGLMINN